MPLTANTPKPMLIVKGKPILEHIVLQLRQDGFRNIVISVNYLSECITNYFNDGHDFGVNITYIHENKPLGTAGALYDLASDLRGESIIVTNADILSGVSYLDLLMYSLRHSCDGLMAVRTQEWQNPFGVVQSKDQHITNIVEKPIHRFQVNAGLYVLSNKLLQFLEPNKYCDMPDLFRTAISEGLDLQLYHFMSPGWILGVLTIINRPPIFLNSCKTHLNSMKILRTSSSNNYLVSICIGEKFYNDWLRYASPSWLDYVDRHDLGLVVFDSHLIEKDSNIGKSPHGKKCL